MSDNQTKMPIFYPNDSIGFVFGELFQVQSELNSYELKNISRIVNVLGGQYTEVAQEHEEITEESNYSEYENETTQEQSTTTSTTESLETFANKHQDKESAFSLSTGAKATYGVVSMQVDASYDNRNASGSSNGVAQTHAKSVVESSRKSVRTRVLTQHRKNTQIRDLETKKQGLDNRGGGNFVAIYRHLSEVHKAKLIKHNKHLFTKIYIPTPSENYSKHIQGVLTATTDSPAGIKFSYGENLPKGIASTEDVSLTFENLTKKMNDGSTWIDNYWLELAAEFGVDDPLVYPANISEIKTHTSAFNDPKHASHKLFTANMKFSVPPGYYPDIAKIGNVNRVWEKTVYLQYVLPNKDSGSLQKNQKSEIKLNFGSDDLNNISIQGNSFDIAFMAGVSLATLLSCEIIYTPSKTTLNLWRLNFYNQILEAVEGKPTAEDKLGLSRRVNVLANADAAKKLIQEELQRETIQYILGTDLKGFDGHWRNLSNDTPEHNYPEINIDKTNNLQPIVDFLHSAFDFGKMSYRFLPAYLGAEDNRSKLFDSKNMGEIRDFLQASWAEVIIPIYRGEEHKLFYMLETGQVWSASDEEAPLPNKRDFLALAEEIEADRVLTAGKEPVEQEIDSWTFNLPTAFEILQEGGQLNDETPQASSNSTLSAGSSNTGLGG